MTLQAIDGRFAPLVMLDESGVAKRDIGEIPDGQHR